MSEDIVTRLRNDVCDTRPCVGCELSSEAADEIERLQEQIKALVHEWELSERGVHNEHKAVRGE